MSNTSSYRRSIGQNPDLVAMSASPECFLHDSNMSSFKAARAAQDSEIAKATTKIDNLVPATTLHSSALGMEFEERIPELEDAARSEGQTDHVDDQTDEEHGYSPDIHHIVQAEIAALGVPSRSEIQPMIIHEIIDYQDEQLFPSHATKSKPPSRCIFDMPPSEQQIYSFGATRRHVKSRRGNIRDKIVEEDNVVSSFASHAKRHVKKAMDDWRVMTNLAKSIAELSDRVQDVAKASKLGSCKYSETHRTCRSRSRSSSRSSYRRDHRRPYSENASD